MVKDGIPVRDANEAGGLIPEGMKEAKLTRLRLRLLGPLLELFLGLPLALGNRLLETKGPAGVETLLEALDEGLRVAAAESVGGSGQHGASHAGDRSFGACDGNVRLVGTDN